MDQVLPKRRLNDEQKGRMKKDANSLADDIKALTPKPGAKMALSFLADRGIEGYQYAWGDHRDLDGSQPLDLARTRRRQSALGIVARRRSTSRTMTWWQMGQDGYGYFKEFGLPAMPEERPREGRAFLETAIPLIERMDKANREMLFPHWPTAKWRSCGRQTDERAISSKSLPATEKPMPMIEPAVVFGVSDAELLKKAMGEYREIINGLIDAARQIEGVEHPREFDIPEPKMTESSSGKIYSFVLPEAWGVDKKIVPNFGLSDKVAVVSVTHDHTDAC